MSLATSAPSPVDPAAPATPLPPLVPPPQRSGAAARPVEPDPPGRRRFKPLLMLALAIELSLLLAIGLLVFGGPPATLQSLLWSGGAVLGVAVIVAAGLPAAWVNRFTLHGALIGGSVLFALPFVWLIGTSFKYPEETFVYPPRWIPEVPLASLNSPYLDTRGLQIPSMTDATLPAGAARVLAPLGFRPDAPEHVRGLAAALQGWTNPDAAAAAAPAIDDELLREAWREVYRYAALGDLLVTDAEGRMDTLPAEAVRWRVGGGRASVDDGGVLAYDLAGGPVTLVAELDPSVLPERVAAVAVSLRQDRTWHGVRLALHTALGDADTTDRLSMSADGFRELTASLMTDGTERDLGIFPLRADTSTDRAASLSGGVEGRHVEALSLTLTPRSAVGAGWAKYTQSYLDAWYADPNWPRYLLNSLWLVAVSVAGQLLSCSMVAYAFSRLRWRGREAWFGVVLATMMLPPLVVMIPTFLIFKSLGLYNTLAPLWLPAFLGTPFFIFLLRQFMLAVPRDLEEAARIDGCGWFGIYWRIILPLMKPALAAVAIFTFMNVWNEFMGPLIYLSDARKFPLSLGLFNFRSENDSDFAMLMAASTLMTLPVITLFFFCQRYFIEGVTLTGVKG